MLFKELPLFGYKTIELKCGDLIKFKCSGELAFHGCSRYKEVSVRFTSDKQLKEKQLDKVADALEKYLLNWAEEIKLEESCNFTIEIANKQVSMTTTARYIPSISNKYTNILKNPGYLVLDNLLTWGPTYNFIIKSNVDNLAEDILNKKPIKISIYFGELEAFYFNIKYDDKNDFFNVCIGSNCDTNYNSQDIPIICVADAIYMIEDIYNHKLDKYYKVAIDYLCSIINSPDRHETRL